MKPAVKHVIFDELDSLFSLCEKDHVYICSFVNTFLVVGFGGAR